MSNYKLKLYNKHYIKLFKHNKYKFDLFQLSGDPEFRGFAMQFRRNVDNELSGEFDWDDETSENVKFMKCDENAPKASITQSKSRRRDELEVKDCFT